MTDLEFIALFRVEELPECGTGLLLLKNWIQEDPETLASVQDGTAVDLLAWGANGNLAVSAWLHHVRICPTCMFLESRS